MARPAPVFSFSSLRVGKKSVGVLAPTYCSPVKTSSLDTLHEQPQIVHTARFGAVHFAETLFTLLYKVAAAF
jgi:hypothetical protein